MSVVATDERKRVFHTLDGLRGVAAISVVLFHMPIFHNLPYTGARFEPGAYLAVDLFFVLSGFVLGFSDDARLQQPGSRPAWSFLVRRVIRLYPLYALGTMIGAAVAFARQGWHATGLAIVGLLFLPLPVTEASFHSSALFPLNFPAWSLFYELIANTVYGFSAKKLGKRVLAVILVIAGCVLVAEVYKRGGLDLGSTWEKKAGGLVRVTFSFFAGVALCKAWRAGLRVPALPAWAVALSPLIVFALPGPRWLVDPVAALFLFPLIVLAGACTEPSNALKKAMVVGGEISYPIYALQGGILVLLEEFASRKWSQNITPASVALSVTYIFTLGVISWLAYRWYDQPARRYLRTLQKSWRWRPTVSRVAQSKAALASLASCALLLVAAAAGYALTALHPPAYRPLAGASVCRGVEGYQAAGARTFLLRPDRLRGMGGVEYRTLIAQANAALSRPAPTVTDKATLPPSGDRHDYISLSTYSWPDPQRPGHAIWRDGQYNPATYTDAYDFSRLQMLVNDGEALALAYHYTGDQHYAAKLAQNLRSWFIAPGTRMNPNLRFAQVDAAGALGDGNGTIDGWHFVYLIDAIGLIQSSHQLSSADMQALQQWFSAYLDWLQTSPQGRHELAATNNHALFYDLERTSFALFSGRGDVAGAVSRYAATHRLRQITFWGALPREESRAKPTHYMAVTAMAFTHLASIAECSDVDMWRAHGLKGGSIRSMIGRMSRFADGRRSWPGGHPPANGEPLVGAFNEAGFAYADRGLSGLASALPNQDYATDEDYRWGGLKGP